MISDKISIDFVREGTGELIFRRQYSRELVEFVCKERDLTEREWVTGTLSKALSFLGWERRSVAPSSKHRRCGPADRDSRYGMDRLRSLRGAKESRPSKPLSRSRWPVDNERHHRRRDGGVAPPLRKARQTSRGLRQCKRTGLPHEKEPGRNSEAS